VFLYQAVPFITFEFDSGQEPVGLWNLGRQTRLLQSARPRTVTQKLYFRALGLKAQALGRLNLNPAAD